MTPDVPDEYASLAERWASGTAPFDGAAWVRDELLGFQAALDCIERILAAVAGWRPGTAVIGDDYINDGDAFFPAACLPLEDIAQHLRQSPQLLEALTGLSSDCSLSILASDYGWLLRLHTFETDTAAPNAGTEATLFISRANMQQLGSSERIFGTEVALWRSDRPTRPPLMS